MADWYLPLYLVPLALLCFPLLLASSSPWRWRSINAGISILPGVTWMLLVELRGSRGKSLSNLVELPILAVGVAVLSLLIPRFSSTRSPATASLLFLLCSQVAAVAIYGLFPDLPE